MSARLHRPGINHARYTLEGAAALLCPTLFATGCQPRTSMIEHGRRRIAPPRPSSREPTERTHASHEQQRSPLALEQAHAYRLSSCSRALTASDRTGQA